MLSSTGGGNMTTITNVVVGQASDGFSILLLDSEGKEEYHWFSQEDTVEQLVFIFEKLGYPAQFEEVY